MARFSVFITFVTLPILYVKSDFIPHRERLMHTGFLWSTIWIFVYYDSPRPKVCLYCWQQNEITT